MSYPLVNCSVDLHDFLAYLKEQKIQIPGVFALRLVKELGILLRKMHASDVMHEDLHEGNVLLSIHTLHNGERRPHLTLIDFESASYDLTISAIRKELDDYQEFYKLTQRLFPSFSDETTNVTPGGANVAQLLEEARKNLAEVFMFTKDPADRTTFDSLWQGVSNAAEDAMKQHNIAEDDGLPDSVLKLIDDAIEEKGVSITEEDLNHEVVL
jgi:serine/threonine protein kinase